MKVKNDEGFTFVETIVAIAIILILSAGVGFTAIGYVDDARTAAARTDIASYKLALQSYYLDCGAYPGSAQGLAALWEKPTFSPVPAGWAGPYVDSEPVGDPWGNDYVYESPGRFGLPFSIFSRGADGAEGGEGTDADIASWKR